MFLLVCSYRYDYREETDTTEDESVESDDSDEETGETKQGNPYLRSLVVSLPQPYDDMSRIRFFINNQNLIQHADELSILAL